MGSEQQPTGEGGCTTRVRIYLVFTLFTYNLSLQTAVTAVRAAVNGAPLVGPTSSLLLYGGHIEPAGWVTAISSG